MMTTEGYDFNTKGDQIGLSVQKKIYLVKIYIMFIGANYYVFFSLFRVQDGYCHTKEATIGAKISGYVNVTSGDQAALKIAIAQKGPVAVGIDASHKSFSFYSFGVYYEPQCGMSLAVVSFFSRLVRDISGTHDSFKIFWSHNRAFLSH